VDASLSGRRDRVSCVGARNSACGFWKLRPCRSCGVLVFVEYAAESVASADVELVESVWFGERIGRWS
jgi:hypothetical protein